MNTNILKDHTISIFKVTQYGGTTVRLYNKLPQKGEDLTQPDPEARGKRFSKMLESSYSTKGCHNLKDHYQKVFYVLRKQI
jgi:hypothetical protein